MTQRHTTRSLCKLMTQPCAAEPSMRVTSTDMQKLPRDFIMTGSTAALISLLHLQRWSWTTHLVPRWSATYWMDCCCILQGFAAGATLDEFHFHILCFFFLCPSSLSMRTTSVATASDPSRQCSLMEHQMYLCVKPPSVQQHVCWTAHTMS